MPVQCLSRCLPCFALPAFHWKARASSFTVLPSRGPTCHVSPRVPSDRASFPLLGLPSPHPCPPVTPCKHTQKFTSLRSQQKFGQSADVWPPNSWCIEKCHQSCNKSSIRERRLGDCKKDPVFNLLYSRRLEHTLYIRITTSPAPLHRVTGEYDKCKSSVISTVSTRGAVCCLTWGSLPRNSRQVSDSCSRRRRPTGCS